MPELPEVQTVVNTLLPRLVNRTIVRMELGRQDIVEPAGVDLPGRLVGRTIRAVERRGKRIIVTLDNTHRFFIHLGMTGQLTVNSPSDPVPSHTHLMVDLVDGISSEKPGARSQEPEGNSVGSASADAVSLAETKTSAKADPTPITPSPSHLVTPSSSQLRFRDPRRFGGIWWLGAADCDAGMGPEPLSVRPRQLAARLARTTRAIKNALLDQSVLAGLGNIYVDESLFASGIHPLTPANQLTSEQIGKLNRAIKTTLRRAIRHRGSTLRDYRDADGHAGDFQSRHRVYGREGKPCRTCKTPIERIVLGGRSTHFCPKCQRP